MDFDKRNPKRSFYRCGTRRRGAKLCTNSRYLNQEKLENLVLKMVSEVVLEKRHLEEYYQKCLEEYSRNQGEREEELKRLRQQLQELEQRIENATEVLMQSLNLKDRFIPKIQSDEDKIRKVKTEIETKNLALAPTGLELGRKLKGQVGDKTLTPTCRHTPYPVLPRANEPIIYIHTWLYKPKKR